MIGRRACLPRHPRDRPRYRSCQARSVRTKRRSQELFKSSPVHGRPVRSHPRHMDSAETHRLSRGRWISGFSITLQPFAFEAHQNEISGSVPGAGCAVTCLQCLNTGDPSAFPFWGAHSAGPILRGRPNVEEKSSINPARPAESSRASARHTALLYLSRSFVIAAQRASA
jgi:hypothetical protein